MMSDKMVRFLNSMKIYNVEDFDLDFEMVGYNRFDRKQLDIHVLQHTLPPAMVMANPRSWSLH